MFSLVDAAILRPLPYPDPDRIVRVLGGAHPSDPQRDHTLNFLDWKRLSTSFEALSATRGLKRRATGTGEPSRLAGTLVSADYFEVFGVEAGARRTFSRRGRAGRRAGHRAEPRGVAGTVRRRSRILERPVILDGEPTRSSACCRRAASIARTRLLETVVFAPEQRTRGYHWLGAVGRLKAASAWIRRGRKCAASRQPAGCSRPSSATGASRRSVGRPAGRRQPRAVYSGGVRRRRAGAAAGAANIANLLLAKGVARRKRWAIRAAMAPAAGRLIAQVLTESLVLCLIGGAAGIGLAYLMIERRRRCSPTLPATAALSLDLRVLGFAAAGDRGVAHRRRAAGAADVVGALGNAASLRARGSSSREGVRRLIVAAEVAIRWSSCAAPC